LSSVDWASKRDGIGEDVDWSEKDLSDVAWNKKAVDWSSKTLSDIDWSKADWQSKTDVDWASKQKDWLGKDWSKKSWDKEMWRAKHPDRRRRSLRSRKM